MERITTKLLKSKYGLTVHTEFVPFSKSRNKDNKEPSLNWRVTLMHNDRHVMTTDYSAGCGHCPAYDNPIHGRPQFMSIARDAAIRRECESGYEDRTRKQIPPIDAANVVYSVVIDASALYYASFEDWACEYGYDIDSRKGEAIYRECLATGFRLQAALGASALEALREDFQDF